MFNNFFGLLKTGWGAVKKILSPQTITKTEIKLPTPEPIEPPTAELSIPELPEQEPQETQEREANETDLIISNFAEMVHEMAGDGYFANRGYAHPNERSRSGGDSKQWSADRLVGTPGQIGGILGEAIMFNPEGAAGVARLIEKNGGVLQDLVEALIFAIYEGSYAKWGGGVSSYYMRMEEIREILMGDSEYNVEFYPEEPGEWEEIG